MIYSIVYILLNMDKFNYFNMKDLFKNNITFKYFNIKYINIKIKLKLNFYYKKIKLAFKRQYEFWQL